MISDLLMTRTYARLFAALAAAALFAGLVYFVLRVAQVSDPAPTTVHGPTTRRLWATGAAAAGLASAIAAGLACFRPAGRYGRTKLRFGAVSVGAVAAINGVLVLVFAEGGPGSGNGVVGGAAALVLGSAAVALSGLALARSRRTAHD